MTALAAVPVAAGVLAGEKREAGLVELARDADWKTHENVMRDLAMLAHPSLSPGRRADLFEDYRDCAERSTALLAGVADWTQEMPELACDDPQNYAAWALEDRANEALYALINGESER